MRRTSWHYNRRFDQNLFACCYPLAGAIATGTMRIEISCVRSPNSDWPDGMRKTAQGRMQIPFLHGIPHSTPLLPPHICLLTGRRRCKARLRLRAPAKGGGGANGTHPEDWEETLSGTSLQLARETKTNVLAGQMCWVEDKGGLTTLLSSRNRCSRCQSEPESYRKEVFTDLNTGLTLCRKCARWAACAVCQTWRWPRRSYRRQSGATEGRKTVPRPPESGTPLDTVLHRYPTPSKLTEQ